jgi:hypothetical protein
VQARYELKLPVSEIHLPVVEAWVRVHRSGFQVAYPPRQVNNIYFESPTWSGLDANLAGTAERAKLRLRWYGTTLDRARGTLELKRKHGAVGTKVSQPIGQAFDLGAMSWTEVVRALRAEDLGPLAPWSHYMCRPVLINHYQRQYFQAADGQARLTIDTGLVAYLQCLTARPNLRRRQPGPAVLIVEVKVPDHHGRRAEEITADFPVRPSAFSKFTCGLIGNLMES